MIKSDRLLARLDELARIGATPQGGVNRPALSPLDRAARSWLATAAQARGFALYTDALANLFIRRDGRGPDRPPVLIGSHLDSQPSGGRFDGALGTLAAFECLETLEDQGIATDHPVEVVAWTNEEGSRFEPGTMGSKAFAGKAQVEDWLAVMDGSGARFGDELAATLAALPQARPRPIGVPPHAYVELHIEQGQILEAERITIGVVTGVQGARWFNVVVDGEAAHAGTTPLSYRHDALAAAARLLAQLPPLMVADGTARLTCGRLVVEPGSTNVIPGRVVFTIDSRHPEPARLDAIEARIRAMAAAETTARMTVERTLDLAPCRFDPVIVAAIDQAAADLGLSRRHLPSGAFHDALHLAAICPAGMIFVPCRGGISHNEAESIVPDDAIAGTEVLLAVTRQLAGG
ncbi:MAG: Zn-dependent hydrolase [Azospirillaceae bacterium]|nr:Zn-dependent hydrolase [Azospirillaceae bacterium]